jgi:hypothetical protein
LKPYGYKMIMDGKEASREAFIKRKDLFELYLS